MSDATTFADEDGEENTLDPEFATATMGHVLLGQGRAGAAREVFRAVLAREASNSEAARGLALLDGASRAEALTVTAADAGTLRATWTLAPHADAPHLRVVSIWVEAATLHRSEHTQALDGLAGTCVVAGLPRGAVHHAAIGTLHAGTFVPLAIAAPLPGADPPPHRHPPPPPATPGGLDESP